MNNRFNLFVAGLLSTLVLGGLAVVDAQQGGGIQGGIVNLSSVTGTLGRANGGTGLTTAPDDNTIVGSGTAWVATAVPNCGDATHALAYSTSTNAFSCQVVTGSGGVAQTTGTFNAQWVTGCSDDPTSVFSYVLTGNTVTVQISNSVSCTSDATSKQTAAGALPLALRSARVQSLKYSNVSVAGVATEMCYTLQLDGQIQMHTGPGCGTNPGNNNFTITAGDQTSLTYMLN